MSSKTDIRQYSLAQLTEHFVQRGEAAFRAKQVYQWLWQKGAWNFDEMTNLSKPLRQYLDTHFVINSLRLNLEQKSSDGTIKCRFALFDDKMVEGVLIPADERVTACVSSQVGCSLTCKFCATGQMKRMRNLNPDEIFDQIITLNRLSQQHYERSLSNIVFMGMGEPLLNYANVMAGIEKICSPQGLGMSPRRVTLSTAGIAKMISKLADDEPRFNLALSLHAANDEKRNQIMPINETNSLAALQAALVYYHEKTQNPVFIEYLMLKDFNDSLQDAQELLRFCRAVPCKVNLIEYNAVEGTGFMRTDGQRIDDFLGYLNKKGLIATLRRSRGKDIDAACGQLANK
ncbi:MAG: 23S rRNA (adenine(2503)-C(2))-methyltransferase RlmN [Sphingobacteriales bacterium]|nr:23S rRNA (adenine(2503)-C(2))-methyltransferase RlmN [Sphingobacteriales bacterium]